MNTPADMSLKEETLLEYLMITTTVAMASATAMEAEMATIIVHLKTMTQATSQELVIVASGLRLNQLATTTRN